MIRPEVNHPEAGHQSFQDIVDHSLTDVFPRLEERDGYDPSPREVPAELEPPRWVGERRSIPSGHIALRDDFEPPKTDINPASPTSPNDLA